MTSHPIDKTHPLWANMTEDEGLKGEAHSYGMLYRERPPGPEHRFAAEGVTMTALDLLPGLAASEAVAVDFTGEGATLLSRDGLLVCHPAALNDWMTHLRRWPLVGGDLDFSQRQCGVHARFWRRFVLTTTALPVRTMLDIPAGSVRYWASEVSIERREEGFVVRSKLALASGTPLTLLATGGAW